MKPEDREFIRRVADEVKSWPEWKRKDMGFKGPEGDYEDHVPTELEAHAPYYEAHALVAKTNHASSKRRKK